MPDMQSIQAANEKAMQAKPENDNRSWELIHHVDAWRLFFWQIATGKHWPTEQEIIECNLRETFHA